MAHKVRENREAGGGEGDAVVVEAIRGELLDNHTVEEEEGANGEAGDSGASEGEVGRRDGRAAVRGARGGEFR